jgi:hypothetical protein
LSRFERQATEGGDLPALLGSATEEFRRSLERHVQQIVDAAKEQAAEIERDAQRNAREKEQQLDVRAQELVQGVVNRAASVLDSIELVQTAISGMLAELRSEVKALESGASSADSSGHPAARPPALIGTDQRQAKEAPATPSQARVEPTKPQADVEPTKPQAQDRIEASQPPPAPKTAASAAPVTTKPESAPAPPKPEPASHEEPGPLAEAAADNKTGSSRVSDSSAEFDQMIHGEIRRMFQSGKSREDVESFLARFELGDSYDGLLDELYSQKDPSSRRRIFGRRRDR